MPNMRLAMLRLRRAVATDCWAALLFVALFTRALIPVGFMPTAAVAGVQLVLCQGIDAGMPAAGRDPAAPHIPGHDPGCPFFQSAPGGPAPAASLAALFHPLAPLSAPQGADRYRPATRPTRHSSPRGPPQFA